MQARAEQLELAAARRDRVVGTKDGAELEWRGIGL
jgi:hypothetical protein